ALVTGLVAALGLLAWVAWTAVNGSAVDRFERDLTARSDLAVTRAREALAREWDNPQPEGVRTLLADIVRDERLIGARACRADGFALVAETPGIPASIECDRIGPKIRPLTETASGWTTWSISMNAPGGAVHVTAAHVRSSDRVLGFVVLVRDFADPARRRTETLRLI